MRKSRQSQLEAALKQIIDDAEKALSEAPYSSYQIGKQNAWAKARDIAQDGLSGRVAQDPASIIDFC